MPWVPFIALLLLPVITWAASFEVIPIRVDDVPLQVEVADEEDERRLGLMYRRELPPGQGMLFVYEDERTRGFWMKNTPLPLDLAFIDGTGLITEVVPLEPLSETPVYSALPARYALEVPRGWFALHRLRPGARLTFAAEGTQPPDRSRLNPR